MHVLALRGVHVHARHRYAGEHIPHLLLHLLGARAEILDVLAAAFRAALRRGNLVAAVVAAQPVINLVIRQRHIALGTFHSLAAGPAGDKCGMAASVDEQYRLMAFLQTLPHGQRQFAGEDGTVAQLQFLAHVHHLHLRQRFAVGAAVHFNQREPVLRLHSRHGTHIRGNGRRGAAQNEHAACAVHALPRNLAGIVAGALVGEVAGLMLLVHNDHAQILHWGEHRASRAHDHPRLAPADAPPFVEALAGG